MNKYKLSDRVRPNSEAAPWVIDEIILLEQKLDKAYQTIKLAAEKANNYDAPSAYQELKKFIP